MSPGAQHPEGEAPRKEVPVDWQARSQVLEEALTKEERAALLHILNDYMILFVGEWAEQPDMQIRPGPDESVLNEARRKLSSVAALGLPDEEGEGRHGG